MMVAHANVQPYYQKDARWLRSDALSEAGLTADVNGSTSRSPPE